MTKENPVEVKLYLNGFPKAGTHALNGMGAALMYRLSKENWYGNIKGHAFTTKLARDNKSVIQVLDDFYPGRFLKGHLAYSPEIAQAFQDNRICKAFIFRDFRDVAISATFHARANDGDSKFPNSEFYASLEFDEVLKRVITGDETIVGVMERWEMFAPWMDEEWVLKLAYEDYLEYPEEVAGLFIRYVYGKSARYAGYGLELDRHDYESAIQRIMAVINRPDLSATYRSGKSGEWKKYFTDEHIELFNKSDKNNWIERLGYDDRN